MNLLVDYSEIGEDFGTTKWHCSVRAIELGQGKYINYLNGGGIRANSMQKYLPGLPDILPYSLGSKPALGSPLSSKQWDIQVYSSEKLS